MEAVLSQETAVAPPDFESLLVENQSMVFSLALHFLRDRSAAEEVAQDVFLALHRNLRSIQTGDHARHWLRRVTAQRCIDRARRVKVRNEVSLGGAELTSAGGPPDVLAESRLRRLVASLPEPLRAAVILRYQEDLDVSEIAETLGIPVRTARAHLDKALALLREKEQRWTR
jgi:RNA polymerase sigma-70 factor (ECF subfamily)